MQNNILKPELVHALNLEHHGYTHPEAVLLALETAQDEICTFTGLIPGSTFSLGNHILQSLSVPQANLVINMEQQNNIMSTLLQYDQSGVFPDRIVNFHFASGDRMVVISTYRNGNFGLDGFNIPCFSIATLYLANHTVLSVVFAPFH